MKAFSPAGPAVKAFFGYGAKTFGNPSGATSGDGAVGASTTDGISPNLLPPPATPPPPAPVTANAFIFQDFIGAAGQPGVRLSTILTDFGLLTQWQAGAIDILNISLANNPARGYWVVTGGPDQATVAPRGFAIDTLPNKLVTINFDLSSIRIYGAGGQALSSGNGVQGGNAINFDITGVFVCNINISLTNGITTGRLFGGGGGGGNVNGGGGVGGWFGGVAAGTGTNGPVYDLANGGTNIASTVGGAGGVNSGRGGVMGAAGVAGTAGLPGPAGMAVFRQGTPGTSVITSGNSPNNVRGTVQ